MTIARKHIVCVEETPYYHVIGRCVRRAFLCGVDVYTGNDYQHRRIWIVDRLTTLAGIFAIDLCAYSIMTNHYHLVVRLDPKRAQSWDDAEVVRRWGLLFGIPIPIKLGLCADASDAQKHLARELIETRRQRLGDLGWYMKALNEYVARKANTEDCCTGAFWESRFKSQALLDAQALLACMAYVDLNPIRARMAECLEESDFTSIQQRIRDVRGIASPLALGQFRDQTRDSDKALPFELQDYLALVDWTGRAICPVKLGAISEESQEILATLGLKESAWMKGIKLFEQPTPVMVGSRERIRTIARRLGRCWYRGSSKCASVFGTG